MLRSALAALALIAAAPAALAQDPRESGASGPSFQILQDLASTLGEAHAIRTLCNGDSDQTWRTYMMNLLDLEAPSNPRRSTLTSAFNKGYRTQSSKRSSCTPDLVQEEARIAARGRQLAESVVQTYLQ